MCVFALLVTHFCLAAKQRQKQSLIGEYNKEGKRVDYKEMLNDTNLVIVLI